MSAHTPGPWVATPETYPGSSDYMIGRAGHKPDEVAVCNRRDANLIAAAPVLLGALYSIVERIDAEHGSPTFHRDELDAARAAIAKATGEQP
ncbi:MAG: hypothetical protein AB7S42_11540 [Lysobacteraceae bacterium]